MRRAPCNTGTLERSGFLKYRRVINDIRLGMDATTTLNALTVGFNLVTICWTARLLQDIHDQRARFLVGMVGIMAIFHGLRLLSDPDLSGLPAPAAYGILVDLLVAILVFAALLILNAETERHRATQMQLRLSRAAEPAIPSGGQRVVSKVLDASQPAEHAGIPRERPEVMLDRLIQASSVAIVALDSKGCVCTCNRAAEQLFHVEQKGLLGQPLHRPKSDAHTRDEPESGLQTAEAHS